MRGFKITGTPKKDTARREIAQTGCGLRKSHEASLGVRLVFFAPRTSHLYQRLTDADRV